MVFQQGKDAGFHAAAVFLDVDRLPSRTDEDLAAAGDEIGYVQFAERIRPSDTAAHVVREILDDPGELRRRGGRQIFGQGKLDGRLLRRIAMHIGGQAAHVVRDGRQQLRIDLAADGLEFQPLHLAGEGFRRHIHIRHEAHERRDLLTQEVDGGMGDTPPEIDFPCRVNFLPDLADRKRILTDPADHCASIPDRLSVDRSAAGGECGFQQVQPKIEE